MKHQTFWLENPKYLFSDVRVLPKNDMTLEGQMNCLTRLVILVFLILFLVGYKQSVLFLILSIIFIIILYYLQKSKMTTCENYSPSNLSPEMQSRLNYIEKTEKLYDDFKNQKRYTVSKHPSYYNFQVEKEILQYPNQTYNSVSQNLVGDANPKTKIRPVVARPSHEWTYWKQNDFVFPNSINERTVQDYYSSGYYIDEEEVQDPKPKEKPKTEEYVSDYPVFKRPNQKVIEEYGLETPNSKDANNYAKSCSSCSSSSKNMPSPFQQENGDFKKFDVRKDKQRYPGDVNDACGYNESNLEYNLPVNYAASNCQRDKNVSGLNNQVFTSTITPGVYYKNDIIEPLNWNIGISFDQQIPPRKVSYDNEGNKIYTAMDPRLYEPVPNKPNEIDVPSNYDIYDPRSNGYGTSYRGYVDKLTGQPRFYYDDIDAIRRPNYVVRSEVDFLKEADTYGPIRQESDEISINRNIRKTAETSYSDNTLDFRTDMMTRLMRKRNAEMWQVRMAPKAGMMK